MTRFTLELLHFSDQEAAAAAVFDAPRLSAVLNALRAQDLGDDGQPDYTLALSSGDSFIPSLFFDASAAIFGAPGIADIQIQNELRLQAISLGNHEFDFGTGVLAGLIDGSAGEMDPAGEDFDATSGTFAALTGSTLEGLDFEGAQYPYLSANLDFSADPATAPLAVPGGDAPRHNVLTASTVIALPANGEAMASGENGFTVTPIFTVGETFGDTGGALNETTKGDYTPVGVLDGLGAYALDDDTVRVFANHELGNGDGYAFALENGLSLTGARISYFDIDTETKQIVDAGLAINAMYAADGREITDAAQLVEGRAGLDRLCSGVLVEAEQFGEGRGLADRIYFAGEETGGVFSAVSGNEWALDPETGDLWAVPAMGRGAWENVTEVDTGTTDRVAFILADDTSPFDADGDGEDEAAPLFLYVGEKGVDAEGESSTDFLARNGLAKGTLHVWAADGDARSPADFAGAGSEPGTWVALDNARNLDAASEDGSTGYDEYGYPTQRNLWTQAEAAGAFGFSRPEDVATNPEDGTEIVLASTGAEGAFDGADSAGTLYTVKLDFSDIDAPKGTATILYDGDADETQALRSPDNVDWADDGLIYAQEDRAASGLFGPNAANPNDASIVAVDPASGVVARVAEIEQDVTRGAVDEAVAATGQQDVGNWESSGVLDVSTLFGEDPGSLFLFDVQAHSLDDQDRFEESGRPRLTDGDLKEGGQLAFLSKGADLGEAAELIGVVGATTPTLGRISSPGEIGIGPDWAGVAPTRKELKALASEIQAEVDALLDANPEMNKVVLLAHMQQIGIEQDLARLLENVDIVVAGGSNTRLFDGNDRAREGDSAQGRYPIFVENAGGTQTAVVNTDGSYKYVGRLVLDFDERGDILPGSYDRKVSGAYATDAQGVADLGAEGLVDPEIRAIADAIGAQIVATESNVFGLSDVFLNGSRSGTFTADDPDGVRTQETNLGNLTADANLWAAQAVDDTVTVSIKNGGGIRASIGEVIVPPGGGDYVRSPNSAVLDARGETVKPEGGISQNDIQTALAFNNGLALLTLTKAELVAVLEHGISGLPEVLGGFPQVAGVKFSFDPDLPAGARIVSAGVFDEDGALLAELVRDGEIVGDTDQPFRVVTLNFLADGGDGYPFPSGEAADRVNLYSEDDEAAATGDATFAADGTEQDALAEYLDDVFSEPGFAYAAADTGPAEDERIQNLDFRADGVLPAMAEIVGTKKGEKIVGTADDDTILARGGNDRVKALGGDDTVRAGDGRDKVRGGDGADVLYGENGKDRLVGDEGRDTLVGGAGKDFMLGGGGADTFVLSIGDRRDVIGDFDVMRDRLAFEGDGLGMDDLDFEQRGARTHVVYGDEGDRVVLRGVEMAGIMDGDVIDFV